MRRGVERDGVEVSDVTNLVHALVLGRLQRADTGIGAADGEVGLCGKPSCAIGAVLDWVTSCNLRRAWAQQ